MGTVTKSALTNNITDQKKVEEKISDGRSQSFLIQNTLVSEQTPFQYLEIVDTVNDGRMLLLDGAIQITDQDDFFYSEMMTHLPIYEHGNVKNVLIIGGGDGTLQRELLKHKQIEKIDFIDIDKRVVEHCREFFSHILYGALDDPRVHFICGDAFNYLSKVKTKYDLVIVDRPDPRGASKTLFGDSFYVKVRKVLRDFRSIVMLPAGTPFQEPEYFQSEMKIVSKYFRTVTPLWTVVPCFVGGFYALIMVSDSFVNNKTFFNINVDTNYYNQDIHQMSKNFPNWFKKLI